MAEHLLRFDGAAAWAALPPDRQAEIGALALELGQAWWLGAEDLRCGLPDPVARAASAAECRLEQLLCDAFEDAASIKLILPGGAPAIPSLLGPVCRVCGCSEEDGCDFGCSWAEPDLCSICAMAPGGGYG